MQVILNQNVAGLGPKGSIKTVSEGYFRNFLAPRRLARLADEKGVAEVKAQKAKALEKLENMKESAQSIRDKVEGKIITLEEKCNDSGHFYAAVSEKEIVSALEAQLKVKVPTKAIECETIKEPGTYQVTLKLHKDVTAKLHIDVSAA